MQIAETSGDEGFEVPRRYLAAVAILVGVFMSALDSAIVNIALPTIATDLRECAASMAWATVARAYSPTTSSRSEGLTLMP
ncbi:hypothetical protein MRS60_34260 [Burkholderia pyrrocinia]|uniref:hypothetical protein n=1 Tax=Burkholderia pyrrocinia TaxID=60550 RepID=UPI0005043FF7|nr:hypothetical protein [Burkholderia pyrrocinia]KFL50021.1 hypothetical protein JM78_32580 [Burkholderia pyrrocinia]UOB60175.1 hypothetical protein MRS60_34260 [Burkholderia pyrrocinia]